LPAPLNITGTPRGRLRLILRNPGPFLRRVGRGLGRNQVLLLSGALAYNALLSIIPFFALILLILSHVMDQEGLLETLTRSIELFIPGQAELVIDQVRGLLNVPEVGFVAIGLLLFFSASAFLVLERALERIFEHRTALIRRHVLVSVIIPYLYMLVLGLGLIAMTFVTGLLGGLEARLPEEIGGVLPRAGVHQTLLTIGGFFIEFLLLTSFYWVMPAGRIRLRQAAVGGIAAALLWEIVRRIFGWYLTSFSPVNLVYGSLATVIVSLLLLEIGAIILLIGAQVIAEYERFVYRERYRPPTPRVR
jgi:YihY family inner membrane protein